MLSKYVPPAYKAPMFTCPHCDALASMDWHWLPPLNKEIFGTGLRNFWEAAVCAACGDQSLWMTQSKKPAAKATAEGLQMCYPARPVGPPPTEDMPAEILQDYAEARHVAAASPRAAAALLRLCVQKLCKLLGEPGENINADIKALVSKGLTPHAQRAFDTVRIVGNNAVHPGRLSDDDMESTVPVLFQIVTFVVDDLITKPRLIDAAYASTPQSARDAADRRDGRA